MRRKAATITGTGTWELQGVMNAARANGIEDINILTHPFEFIIKNNGDYSDISPSRVNQRRLEVLCQRLADPSSGFRAATFSDRAPAWLEAGTHRAASIKSPLLPAVLRMVGNKVDTFCR